MGGGRGAFDGGNAESGAADGFADDAVNPFGVHTAGYFGNYPLPRAVEGDLGGDYIGKDNTVMDDSGGTFIAGRFDAKDNHGISIYQSRICRYLPHTEDDVYFNFN